MMWMWISAIVILLGAELNAEIEHQTAKDSTVHGDKPLGGRGAAMADTVGAPADGKDIAFQKPHDGLGVDPLRGLRQNQDRLLRGPRRTGSRFFSSGLRGCLKPSAHPLRSSL